MTIAVNNQQEIEENIKTNQIDWLYLQKYKICVLILLLGKFIPGFKEDNEGFTVIYYTKNFD